MTLLFTFHHLRGTTWNSRAIPHRHLKLTYAYGRACAPPFGQSISLSLGLMVERYSTPYTGLLTFMASWFVMLWIAWRLAIRITALRSRLAAPNGRSSSEVDLFPSTWQRARIERGCSQKRRPASRQKAQL